MVTTQKSQKKKHVRCKKIYRILLNLDLMAWLKGAHSEISASQALMKILQRFIENTENWSVNIKVFIIIHRWLQDYDLSEPVAHELSEKADILTHYKKKPSDNTYGKLEFEWNFILLHSIRFNFWSSKFNIRFKNGFASLTTILSIFEVYSKIYG